MKTVGIVAEYNPFHRGHKYHLQRSLEITGADCVVSVMSGNFTQRGEISPWDKWERSKAAIIAGVNLVLELPFVYAVNQGEMFARGAVDILATMNVDYISFGSEVGDIEVLKKIAAAITEKQTEIDTLQRQLMKDGSSYAKSRSEAISKIIGEEAEEVITKPNNILAIEYIKRINYWNQNGKAIEPITVKRFGSGYFEVNDENGYAGASEIRATLARGESDAVAYFIPEELRHMIETGNYLGPAEARLLEMIHADSIRKTSQELAMVYCMGEGLENKIKADAYKSFTLTGLVEDLTSKRYTSSAMRRLLLYMAMNLTGDTLPEGKYCRILAADETGRDLIREVKKYEDCNVITNINKTELTNQEDIDCLQLDLRAAAMYNFLLGRDAYKYSDNVISPFML